ncbi:MAG: undecaprenyl-diphosphate phosphatase, partial [Bdellovibrionota bacterium]|nr:undecaprenyl-diphosphate phosphatase [Bdellovibrionota bacterium]
PLAELYGRTHLLIAFNLIFFGVSLYVVDKYAKNIEDVFKSKGSVKTSLLVGFFQVLAIFPGVSRSGITITAARLYGATKEDASSFSFLLSLPLIFGGALLKYLELKKSSLNFDYAFCIVGIVVSFVIGILTIHYFLKLVKKIDFKYFMYYRLALGLLVCLLFFFH